MNEDTPVGRRIAYYRNRRQLSQQTLANQVGRSTVWLSKVERGELPMDSISVLRRLAKVLRVGTWDLFPQLGEPPNGGAPLGPSEGVPAIRGALFAAPDSREPLEVDALRDDIERLNETVANGDDGDYRMVVTILPQVLIVGANAVSQGRPAAHWYLAQAYHLASRFARNVGERDLALLSADRAVAAALAADDQLLIAVARRDLAFALLHYDLLDRAATVCSDAADAIAPSEATSLAGWSLWGSLLLTQSVIVARDQERMEARRLLRDARGAADRVGPGRNDYWEAFGPANVGAHEVAVALELDDPVEALRFADRVEVQELPNGLRRARFLLDVARAHTLRTDDAATVLWLLEAERHSPDGLRFQLFARELVSACLKRNKRAPGLRALADRLGVTK